MKYISLDIETSGLKANVNSILEIAAIIDDSDPLSPLAAVQIKNLPRFHAVIDHNQIVFDMVALQMNFKLLEANIHKTNPHNIHLGIDKLAIEFQAFLEHQGFDVSEKINFAGKNFASFDRGFLKQVPEWDSRIKMAHRFMDPTMMYFDPGKDQELPSLVECMKKIGIVTTANHSAIEDAENVILCLRRGWEKQRSS